MTVTVKGNRHKGITHDGDFYTHRLTMYSDAWEFPREFFIDEHHTVDAYERAKAEILEHENEVGKVTHAWLTRVDATCTDNYRETVFEYSHGKWTLH